MMKSSGSVAGAVLAGRSLDRQEAGQDGAGRGGTQGSWPYLLGHAANGV